MVRTWPIAIALNLIAAAAIAEPAAPVSDATQECLDCHSDAQPGLVHDWKTSRHARTTPAQALGRPDAERRMSAAQVPDALRGVAVGCFECHGLNPKAHKDNFEHNGYRINVVVSPADCRTCHPTEVDQYSGSKKAHAWGNLALNPVYSMLVDAVDGVIEVRGRKQRLAQKPASQASRAQTCFACHGTKVEVTGTRKVDTDDGEMTFPILSNWPNQGVGRINPDGSRGACTPCHPRHGFSLEVARKPHTCGQCHLEPDVPAYNVFLESKHGNIYESVGHGYDWDHVPWRVGLDFRAPTCAACHMAGLAKPDGEAIVARSHDFGARIWVRLFGLVVSHPQPKTGQTHIIKNADGLPLPATFAGKPAAGFLIDDAEQASRKAEMSKVCAGCHTGRWVEGHFAAMDAAIAEADQMVHAATALVAAAWKRKRADKGNPFDEWIERQWVRQWLFYANSVRYAAAMGGPDYATFKNGWFYLSENLHKMRDWLSKKGR